jgi:hypothetical protein
MTSSAPAYLLCLQALHQRFHPHLSSIFCLPSVFNDIMADDASRLFDLSDEDLLTHFNTFYPRTSSWRSGVLHPTKEMLFKVTSTLHRWRAIPASFLHAPIPATRPGSSGPSSVATSTSTRGSLMWWAPTRCCSCKQRHRAGHLAPSQRPVKSCTVEGALRAVGQTFASAGGPGPLLTASGKHEFRLCYQLAGCAKADPPSNRNPNPNSIAFFFLMRPGEHIAPTGGQTRPSRSSSSSMSVLAVSLPV